MTLSPHSLQISTFQGGDQGQESCPAVRLHHREGRQEQGVSAGGDLRQQYHRHQHAPGGWDYRQIYELRR